MKTVVVVDDDPVVLQALKKGIESHLEDVTVQCFTTVREAEEAMEAAESVHLVLSDIVMPVETGWELLRWLKGRERFKSLPVLVMSGFVSESDAKRAGSSLIGGFVSKPIDFDQLADTISRKLKT